MKSIYTVKKNTLILLSAIILAWTLGLHPVKASDIYVEYNSYNVSKTYEEFTPYIKVEGNKYILDLPDNITVSDDVLSRINMQLDLMNEIIENNHYSINKETKIATPIIMTRAYGKTDVKFHWNYIELYLDRGVTKAIIDSGGAAGVAYFMAKFTPTIKWFKTNPATEVSVAAFASTVVANIIDYNVKDGIIVHYNFIYGTVTKIKRQ